LGSSGAIRWFAPVQPFLALAGIGLLGYALRRRLAGERACPIDTSTAGDASGDPVLGRTVRPYIDSSARD
jgi:hypothetical protein